jgi:hypothetical protein
MPKQNLHIPVFSSDIACIPAHTITTEEAHLLFDEWIEIIGLFELLSRRVSSVLFWADVY